MQVLVRPSLHSPGHAWYVQYVEQAFIRHSIHILSSFSSVNFSFLAAQTVKIAGGMSSACGIAGPDPGRPAKPSLQKLISEQALCAATIDMNDCKDAAGLQQSLVGSLHIPAQVRVCGCAAMIVWEGYAIAICQ